MEKTIKVDGMTCGHCAETVTKTIQNLGGIRQVNVDLDRKEVAVAFDESLTPLDKIEAAIGSAGFEVVAS